MNGKLLCVLCFFCVAVFCSAQDASVNISYYDKKVYFAGSDPIYILVTVVNNSPLPYRFKLADDRAFSLDFDTRTRANIALEQADALRRRRSTASQVFYRDLTIEAGESFSFVENLRDYTYVEDGGNYIVQAKLYPELLDTAKRQTATVTQTASQNITQPATGTQTKALLSNRLSLQIKPQAIIGSDGLAVALDVETGAVLAREKLSPDQVITWTLRARQKSEWEKFFLYLEIEKMLERDGPSQRRWRAESEEGRRRMIANYRSELQKAKIDGDISAIPMQFDIERTTYGRNTGTVEVLEKFKVGDYIERKRYTYYLENEDGYWYIVDYTVMNLGTE